MTKCKEFEFKGQDRPNSVLHKSNIELTKRIKALLPIRALSETIQEPLDIRPGSMLEEGQEQIFFALEMRIDRALAAARRGGDLIQLGALISVSYKDFFRGIEKPCLRFLDPKLLFTQSFHGQLVPFKHLRLFLC